jgi:hypothetical protein
VINVMRKAQELGLERVEAMCVMHCRDCMSVHNAVEWFVQAHAHGGALAPPATCGTVA